LREYRQRELWASAEKGPAADEVEQVLVEGLLVGAGNSVRSAELDFQGGIRDQEDGLLRCCEH
jgi:hypothetical protein